MLRAMRNILGSLVLGTLTLAFCIALIVIPSCGSVDCKDPKNGSNAKCAVENAVIDCTTKTAQDFVVQHLGDISKFFGNEGVDWKSIEDALTKLIVPEAVCVLETAWDNYFAPTPVLTDNAGVTTPPAKLHDTSADAAKKTALINKLWPGKKVQR